MGEKNPRSGILADTEVVVENILDKLITGLVLVVIGDMFKSLIDGYEESIVLISAVEKLSKLFVLLNELKKLLCIVALGDEFVCGVVCKVAACSAEDGCELFVASVILVGQVVEESIFVLELVVDSGRDLSRQLIGRLIERLAETVGNVLESLLDIIFEVVESVERLWEDES